MKRLGAKLLRQRLAFDYRIVSRLRSPILGYVRAFASVDDARAQRALPAADAEGGRAGVYDVEYRFPILVSRDRRADSAVVRFALLGKGGYPFTEPIAETVSRPLPWTPHVHDPTGRVCLGNGWVRADGEILFAHLVGHVARLLNFDEPRPSAGYTGYNADAIAYWRDVLNYRPLNPNLQYPLPPSEITHGVEKRKPLFRPSGATVFRPEAPSAAEAAPAHRLFLPLGRVP